MPAATEFNGGPAVRPPAHAIFAACAKGRTDGPTFGTVEAPQAGDYDQRSNCAVGTGIAPFPRETGELRMTDLERRLAGLEERLRRLEEARGGAGSPAPAGQPIESAKAPAAAPTPARRVVASPPQPDKQPAMPAAAGRSDGSRLSMATGVLGISGAAALVLAAMYLIRLAIDSGWLTPSRQMALAALSGLALIALGLALAGRRRRYAALLPGAGVVILFLTVFGAHVYHGLIGAPTATAAVADNRKQNVHVGAEDVTEPERNKADDVDPLPTAHLAARSRGSPDLFLCLERAVLLARSLGRLAHRLPGGDVPGDRRVRSDLARRRAA